MANQEIAPLGFCCVGKITFCLWTSLSTEASVLAGVKEWDSYCCLLPRLVPLNLALFHGETYIYAGGCNFEQSGCSLWQEREVQRSRATL